MKQKLIVANWKMNQTLRETEAFCQALLPLEIPDVEAVICPPFTALRTAQEQLRHSGIRLGAQNMNAHVAGAFTGEISPLMLRELEVNYVLLGHSERRTLFGEKDEALRSKFLSALEYRFIPILCIGETLAEREKGATKDVIEGQMRSVLHGLNIPSPFVIAYEPVWAIGTGRAATPSDAEEVHEEIHSLLQELLGAQGASVRILYGGSMNPSNAEALLRGKNIDGGLIGGASLKAESFGELLSIAQRLS
ncbi:MAG: triose-phosphate isomerase [Puniceicoccales bacterium]|jgi:triosephosphate isomerase|nr:triose-phosphate isomerase [Puniceicoccales bacterium]